MLKSVYADICVKYVNSESERVWDLNHVHLYFNLITLSAKNTVKGRQQIKRGGRQGDALCNTLQKL